MADSSRRGWVPAPGSQRVYELEVFLVGGPVTEQFAKENRVVSRTIQMRGDQTLEHLEGGGGGKYPKVTVRVGTSPPQYPDLDEEDDDDQ